MILHVTLLPVEWVKENNVYFSDPLLLILKEEENRNSAKNAQVNAICFSPVYEHH